MAVRVLRTRLDTVWRLLPEASSDRQQRAEDVHQLRVATRRSLVALDVFGDLVPQGRRRWFERRLREIRRAAGEARDLDVLAERLSSRFAEGSSKGRRGDPACPDARERRRIIAMLGRRRKASRRPVLELYERLMDEDWPSRVRQLLDRAASGEQVSFVRYARKRFRPFAKAFFRLSDRRLRKAGDLHELRIEGKKLRYALEICGEVFRPKARSRCSDSLEQLQSRLGEFTDHAAAADRFRWWGKDKDAKPSRGALGKLRREEEKLADTARRKFSRWWTPARRRSLRRRFERALRR